MQNNTKDGFQRWLGYMQFKSAQEAFLRFHLILFIISISAVYLFLTRIAINRHSVLASLMTSIFLWLACFSLLRLGFMGNKNKYLERFGKTAYKKAAFRFLLPYGALWLVVVTMPLWVPGERLFGGPPFIVLGSSFILIAVFLIQKTKIAFGLDRLIFVYSYYPDEAKLVRNKICEFIRHPAYAAWVYFGIGFFFLRGSLNSFFSVLLNILAIMLLVKLEEEDIIQDFHEDYLAYKKTVPSLVPKKPGHFIFFLFR